MKPLLSLLLCSFIIAFTAPGCGSSPKTMLIGKWKEKANDTYYEFLESGSFTKTSSSGSIDDGKWSTSNGKDNAGQDTDFLHLEYSSGTTKVLQIISISEKTLDLRLNEKDYQLEKL